MQQPFQPSGLFCQLGGPLRRRNALCWSQVLYNSDGQVVGVATGDLGVAKDGTKRSNYARGIELRARATLFGEGCRGSLSEVPPYLSPLSPSFCPVLLPCSPSIAPVATRPSSLSPSHLSAALEPSLACLLSLPRPLALTVHLPPSPLSFSLILTGPSISSPLTISSSATPLAAPLALPFMQEVMKTFRLREEAGASPQTYGLGLKEVWKVRSHLPLFPPLLCPPLLLIPHPCLLLSLPSLPLDPLLLPLPCTLPSLLPRHLTATLHFQPSAATPMAKVDPAVHKEGLVLHTIGYPLWDTYGGSFLYHWTDNRIILGLVVGLDYK